MTAPVSSHPRIGFETLFDTKGLRSRAPVGNHAAAMIDPFAGDPNGGQLFYWDPGSTASDDGVDVLKVHDIDTGRWLRSQIRFLSPLAQTFSALTGTDHADWHKDDADGAAGTATAETPFYYAARGRTISGIKLLPGDALTASDTNYATITVYKRSADGQTQTTIATMSTTSTGGSGNWVAHVEEAFASLSETELAEGEFLTVEITKTASGVAVPALQLTVEFSDPRLWSQGQWLKDSADALASTTTAEKAFAMAPVRRVLSSLLFIPAAAVTADGTDYVTVAVDRRDSAGANNTAVASFNTSTAGLTAWSPRDLGALSVDELLPGQYLTVEVTKASSGVVLCAGLLVAVYSEATVANVAEWHKDAADAAAATATATKPFYRNTTGRRQRIRRAKFIPAAALTADATDYATLTLAKRDANGANAATVAAITTETAAVGGTGDWTAHVPIDLGDLANTELEDDEQMTVAIAKAGSGVAVPAGQLVVEFDGAETNAEAAISSRVKKLSLTVDESDLTDADGSQTLPMGSLPAGAQVLGVAMHTYTPFTGGSVADMTVDIGATDTDMIVDGADCFAAAVDGNVSAIPAGVNPHPYFASKTAITAIFTCATDDVADATAGTVTIDILYVVL